MIMSFKTEIVFAIRIFAILLVTSCNNITLGALSKECVNPLQFGLQRAHTGIERYYVLEKTHDEALRRGYGVSYAGIEFIDIEMPADARALPLTNYTDFAGVTIRVTNNQKDAYLFSLSSKLKSISVNGKEIDDGNFTHNSALKNGLKLLIIYDKTPWVDRRSGYDYSAIRKDIMLINNGKASNSPIQSYSSSVSIPDGHYCDIYHNKIIIKNLKLVRSDNSTKKTYLIKIENQYDIDLSQISIYTPNDTGLDGDRAIHIINCYKVCISDLYIDGTYSLSNKYGYGVTMDNVCDLNIRNMYGRGHWGVFGNNNVQSAWLRNCDINRFDIHCYGKDIFFEGCNFVDLYNQFASVYGTISFNNCTFSKFKPIYVGSSYNAYTAYDLYFDHCIFNLDKTHSSIIDFSGFATEENKRPELKKKCLPNVTIVDCRVNMVDGLKHWDVFNTGKMDNFKGEFSYISQVTIKKLSGNESVNNMNIFSKDIKSVNKVKVRKD